MTLKGKVSLIIRSRVRWLEEGERSSKYFCNLERTDPGKRRIFTLLGMMKAI